MKPALFAKPRGPDIAAVARDAGGPAPGVRAATIASMFAGDHDRILAVVSWLRRPGRVIESTVQGSSMGATLPDGARIKIELSPSDRYRKGEVVAFLAGPTIVVHRIVHRGTIRRRPGWLLTRGDACRVPDPAVPVSSVLGRVVGVLDREGWRMPGPSPGRPLGDQFLSFCLDVVVALAMEADPAAGGWSVGLARRAGSLARRVRSVGGEQLRRLDGAP